MVIRPQAAECRITRSEISRKVAETPRGLRATEHEADRWTGRQLAYRNQPTVNRNFTTSRKISENSLTSPGPPTRAGGRPENSRSARTPMLVADNVQHGRVRAPTIHFPCTAAHCPDSSGARG